MDVPIANLQPRKSHFGSWQIVVNRPQRAKHWVDRRHTIHPVDVFCPSAENEGRYIEEFIISGYTGGCQRNNFPLSSQ